jgi:hypothetical protein
VTLRSNAEANMLVCIFVGIAMFFIGIISLFSFIDYMDSGEIESGFIMAPCLAFTFIAFFALLAFNLPISRIILRTGPESGRRAAYFQILFPILLVSFLIATPRASFAPSLIFGFPLLLVGALAYPYSAVVVHKWVKMAEMKNLQIVGCFRCTYVFEMHREEKWLRCPYCGQVNMNPGAEEKSVGRVEADMVGRRVRP